MCVRNGSIGHVIKQTKLHVYPHTESKFKKASQKTRIPKTSITIPIMGLALSSPPPILLIIFNIFAFLFLTSYAQTCSNHAFTSKRVFTSCRHLPYLNANLHWNYITSTRQVKIAFRARHVPQGWIAWAINPYRRGMVGSQALVASRGRKGRTLAYTTTITGYNPSMQLKNLSFGVSKLSAEYAGNEMIIFALVGPLMNGPRVNHVWQVGSVDQNGVPQMHTMELQNLQSTGVIDFLSS